MVVADELSSIVRYSKGVESQFAAESSARIKRTNELVVCLVTDALMVNQGYSTDHLCEDDVNALRHFISGRHRQLYIQEHDAVIYVDRAAEGWWEVTGVLFTQPTLH